jgi:hypothetical protein
MITLSKIGKDRVYVQWEPKYRSDKPAPTYMDYNPILGKPSRVRILEYQLLGTMNELSDLFTLYPDARIVNTIGHEPHLSAVKETDLHTNLKTLQDIASWQRVKENGIDVIDEFGFHVYIRSELDFYGTREDIDLRY